MGRAAARALWPLVLQLWAHHPLVLIVIGSVVAIGASLFLSWLWEIIRPPMPRPHEVYRPPTPDDADRRETTGARRER